MTMMTITGTAEDLDGNRVTASVQVEVSSREAEIARRDLGPRVLLRPELAFAPQPVQIPGYSGSNAVKELVTSSKTGPAVTEASKSQTYARFTGGFR